MADENRQKEHQGGAAAEAARRGTAAAAATAQAAGDAARGGAQAGAEAAGQTGRAGAEALQRSGEATAEATRRGGQAGAELVRGAGEAARQGTRAAAEGGRQIAAQAADQLEEVGRRLAQAVQSGAEDVRRLMVLPEAASGGLNDLRQALSGLVEGVVRSNLRATQELLRLVNPAAMVELQQRFAREYIGALVEGQATILRATRRTAEETLRPLEEQLHQRRQQAAANGGAGRVADVMSQDVRLVSPEDTVQQAARIMRAEDVGALPVGEGGRLVGMVTDRDLALRTAADGKDPAQTRVREVMTPEIRYVFADEPLDHAARTMSEQQLRRLPVLDRDKRLVGIVSLADLAANENAQRFAARALGGVVREGGQHTQVAAE